MPFDQVVKKVTEELKKDGLDILTDVDVNETQKKKLNLPSGTSFLYIIKI